MNDKTGGRGKAKKICAACKHACEKPGAPMYGYGGMMLVCVHPNKRRKNTLLVAPLTKCAKWERKDGADDV